MAMEVQSRPPARQLPKVKSGQQRVVEKRLWPGYLLIKMSLTDDSWMFVKNTTGVVDFLGGEKPTELADSEIETLLSDLEDKKTKVTQKHKLQVGDKVKI